MQCEEWADANSELFKEAHDEAVHKNSYKRKFYELISASLTLPGGVSRSRIEPLGPRGAGPAAPSTLAAKPRQPSGIQPSAASAPPCQKEQTPECLPFSSKESINFYQAKGTHLPSLTWRTSRSILGSRFSSNWNLPVAPSKSLICARASRNFFLSVVLPDFSAASCIT